MSSSGSNAPPEPVITEFAEAVRLKKLSFASSPSHASNDLTWLSSRRSSSPPPPYTETASKTSPTKSRISTQIYYHIERADSVLSRLLDDTKRLTRPSISTVFTITTPPTIASGSTLSAADAIETVDPSEVASAVADALHKKYELSCAAFDGEENATLRVRPSRALSRATEAIQSKAGTMMASTNRDDRWYTGEWVQYDGATTQPSAPTGSTHPRTSVRHVGSTSTPTGFQNRPSYASYGTSRSAATPSDLGVTNHPHVTANATHREAQSLLEALTSASRLDQSRRTTPWSLSNDSKGICKRFEDQGHSINGPGEAADYVFSYLDQVGTRRGQLSNTGLWMSRTLHNR